MLRSSYSSSYHVNWESSIKMWCNPPPPPPPQCLGGHSVKKSKLMRLSKVVRLVQDPLRNTPRRLFCSHRPQSTTLNNNNKKNHPWDLQREEHCSILWYHAWSRAISAGQVHQRLLPCTDRAWSSMIIWWKSVLLAANLGNGSFFFFFFFVQGSTWMLTLSVMQDWSGRMFGNAFWCHCANGQYKGTKLHFYLKTPFF